eukprot:241464-Rhodomonas_salina.4
MSVTEIGYGATAGVQQRLVARPMLLQRIALLSQVSQLRTAKSNGFSAQVVCVCATLRFERLCPHANVASGYGPFQANNYEENARSVCIEQPRAGRGRSNSRRGVYNWLTPLSAYALAMRSPVLA